MSYSKLNTVEAVALVLVVITNHLVLNMPQSIINLCGSSSILNMIYVSLIAIGITFMIVKLYRHFTNSDIIDVSEYLGGKFLKVFVGIVIIIYLLVVTSTLLRNFSEGLKITYFDKIPMIVILLLFGSVCVIANRFGENAIIKSNVVISFMIVGSLLLAFISMFGNYTPQRALPILGYGATQTFLSGISNLFAYNGILFLMFIMPMLAKKENYKKISMISIVITSILLILAVATLLLSFSFITSVEELSPIYLIINNTHFGRYFQRPESLFILTWIFSLITYLNVITMFILRIFKKLTNLKSVKSFTIPLVLIIIILALLPPGMASIRFLENSVYKYMTLGITFILCIGILILANIKYKRLEKKQNLEGGEQSYEN